jgi:hypothetical protein
MKIDHSKYPSFITKNTKQRLDRAEDRANAYTWRHGVNPPVKQDSFGYKNRHRFKRYPKRRFFRRKFRNYRVY